jgi:hypothetical protein
MKGTKDTTGASPSHRFAGPRPPSHEFFSLTGEGPASPFVSFVNPFVPFVMNHVSRGGSPG